MADLAKIHPQSIQGSLFVDLSCIDCGTCYHLAPTIFEEASDEHSFVKSQPCDPHEWVSAKRAMVSCPTNSIGVTGAPLEFREAPLNLPLLISEKVYYCGYTSRDSFGASSYFIERPEGNILIDSPRFNQALARELESMGGVEYMILTHRDDVADHEAYTRFFGLKRVIHADEIESDTRGIEIQLALTDTQEFLPGLKLISVPGHTKGHLAILYKDQFLFTGDHIFFDPLTQNLTASRGVCWYSWDRQISSVEKLIDYDFQWVMPGHGCWSPYYESRSMKEKVRDLVQMMRKK